MSLLGGVETCAEDACFPPLNSFFSSQRTQRWFGNLHSPTLDLYSSLALVAIPRGAGTDKKSIQFFNAFQIHPNPSTFTARSPPATIEVSKTPPVRRPMKKGRVLVQHLLAHGIYRNVHLSTCFGGNVQRMAPGCSFSLVPGEVRPRARPGATTWAPVCDRKGVAPRV